MNTSPAVHIAAIIAQFQRRQKDRFPISAGSIRMQAKHSQICSVSRTCKRQNFQSSQEFWDRLGILAACSKMAYDKQICEAISVSFVIHCSSMQARLTSQKESYTANLPARRKLPGHFRTSFDEDCLELACRPSSGNIKNWSYGVRIGSSTRNAFRQGCVCALGLKGYAQNGEKRLGGPALGPGLQRYAATLRQGCNAATLRQGCNARTRYTAARRNSCMAAQRAARASSVVSASARPRLSGIRCKGEKKFKRVLSHQTYPSTVYQNSTIVPVSAHDFAPCSRYF